MIGLERAFWSLGVTIAGWFLVPIAIIFFLIVTGDLAALGVVPAGAWFAARLMAGAWLVVYLPAALLSSPTARHWQKLNGPLAGANIGAAAILITLLEPALGSAPAGIPSGLALMAAGAVVGALTGLIASLTRSFVA